MTSILPLAVARACVSHGPINPLLKHAQVAHILFDSGASLLISGAARLATLAEGDLPADCSAAEEEEGAAMLGGKDRLPPSDSNQDAVAALLYNIGSTGRSKGLMATNDNLRSGCNPVD